jgi:hypothetical protein
MTNYFFCYFQVGVARQVYKSNEESMQIKKGVKTFSHNFTLLQKCSEREACDEKKPSRAELHIAPLRQSPVVVAIPFSVDA